jgi:hypothetical protein
MDDILVYSKDLKTPVKHLQEVLQIPNTKSCLPSKLIAHLLNLNLNIWVMGSLTREWQLILKTREMAQWLVPSNTTELRGFLGLTSYYRKFVQNYGIIGKPLAALLKKHAFQWTPGFSNFKTGHMMSTPLLVLPDFTKQFCIETNACDSGIGEILSQQGHPVAFYSKALGPSNKKLSIYEKEFLTIMMAIDRWRQYISRGPFVIKTDHKSLCHLEDQVLTTDVQKKAMPKLVGLQSNFQYNKGVENQDADALSRVGHVFALQSVSTAQPYVDPRDT